MGCALLKSGFVLTSHVSDYTNLPRSPASDLRSPRSPDTASPIYPERAIRPLPKSKLKSKLSPEAASHIVFPPEPPPLSPTLQVNQEDEKRRYTNAYTQRHAHHDGVRGVGYGDGHRETDYAHCTCGENHDVDSGDEEIEFDHPDYRYPASAASPSPAGHSALAPVNGFKVPLDSVQRRLVEASRAGMKPPPPGSAASSADGYESFENTSNKKKRKIPLSGASLGQSQLSAEIASMAISQNDGVADEGPNGGPVAVAQQQYNPPAVPSGTGISGAGRGRYGRQNGYARNGERRPLAAAVNIPNGQSARVPKAGPDMKNGGDTHGIENTGGIISQAIKSAAEQGPLTPLKGNSGKENSLIQSATAPHPNVTPKTQFTFSCESESATKMEQQQAVAQAQAQAQAAYQQQASGGYGAGTPGAYPSTSPAGTAPIQRGQGMHGVKGGNAQGTQTTPNPRQGQQPGGARPPPPPAAPLPAGQQAGAPGPAPKPKPRRRPSKEYAIAARQRQLQQEYTNYHHRPTKDNMWICEFCEYEDIFGVPPYAMIRRYEIKDRQERKKAAERRRLLEKAKMKGRKGKKGKGKNNNANNAATGTNAPNQAANGNGGQNYDPNLPPPEGDEYYDDEYDDEYGDDYEPVDPNDAAYYPPPGTPAQGVGPLSPPPQQHHQHHQPLAPPA